MRVFVSYTSSHPHDKKLARALANALKRWRIDLFFDDYSLEPGQNIERTIFAALPECTHFLVVVSTASADRPWVRREIDAALEQAKNRDLRVIGLRVGKAQLDALADHLWIDCPDDAPADEIAQSVIGRLLPSVEGVSEATDDAYRLTTCDRQEQEAIFRDALNGFLRDYPSLPQAHLIVGNDDDQHESFIGRMETGHLRTLAWKESGGMTATIQVDWSVRASRVDMRRELVANLFDALMPKYSYDPQAGYTAADLRTLLGDRGERVLVVKHDIASSLFRFRSPRVVLDYLRFWREVATQPLGQHVVLLFSFVFEEGHGIRRGTIRAFARLLATCGEWQWTGLVPTAMVRLTCVRRAHVR